MLKTKVSVLSNDLAIDYAKWKLGSTLKVELFWNNLCWHILQSRKTEVDIRIFWDMRELYQTSPDNWAILCNKGYARLLRHLRAIMPVRKQTNGWLKVAAKLKIQNISADRIIVETISERLWSFQLFGTKWEWSEEDYDKFVQFGIATINVHVLFQALSASDRPHFIRSTNRLLITGAESCRKRTASLNLFENHCRCR